VRIIETMPLTAVGKIFKPDLRLDAIRHCVRKVAARLDEGRTLGIEVRETGGSIAVVLAVRDPSMLDAVDSMRRELERYTFRVEVETSYPT
jgi:fatty-acyl-CoA synthase